MHYPVILYPEEIEDFCRQYPLLEEEQGIEKREQNITVPPRSLPVDADEVKPIGEKKPTNQEDSSKTKTQSKAESNRQKKLTKKNPVRLRSRASSGLLLAVWLFWLIGTVLIVFLGVARNLPLLSIASFVGAIACLSFVVYFWLRGTYRSRRSVSKKPTATGLEKLTVKGNLLGEKQVTDNGTKLQSNQAVSKDKLDNSSISSSSIVEKYQSQEDLKKRNKVLSKLLIKKAQPIGISEARQGVSEAKFLEYLKRYFSQVTQAAEFPIPESKRNYSADFLIVHSATGLGIDCEIDEPYALRSKQPTHCMNKPEDYWRNHFFLERGWIVVRFTERQVVEAPLSCCKAIANVIADVTGDKTCWQQLESVPELLPYKAWTTSEAKKMAKKDYRLSYLPEEVRRSVLSRQGGGQKRGRVRSKRP